MMCEYLSIKGNKRIITILYYIYYCMQLKKARYKKIIKLFMILVSYVDYLLLFKYYLI